MKTPNNKVQERGARPSGLRNRANGNAVHFTSQPKKSDGAIGGDRRWPVRRTARRAAKSAKRHPYLDRDATPGRGRGPFSPPASVAKVNSIGARCGILVSSLLQRSFRLLAMLWLLIPLGAQAQAVVNGDFEQGVTDWSLRDDRGMSEPVPEAARTGSLGLRVTDADPGRGSSAESLAVEAIPGNTYEVSFWARTVSGTGWIQVVVRFFDEKRKSLQKKPRSVVVRPSGQWEQFTVTAKAPENAVAFVVWIHSLNVDEVTMDLDDFTVREVAAERSE